MGRRYAFDLFYPADRLPAVLAALDGVLTPVRRKRTGEPVAARPWDLTRLTPDAPLFAQTSLLVPADDAVRAFHGPDGPDPEWTADGVECLPVGAVGLAIRVGGRFALLTFSAATGRMSDLFRDSPAVWGRFADLLGAAGGRAGLFRGADHRGPALYPLLPDGRDAVELDYRAFVLAERDTYWHLDTDRYADAVVAAPRVAAGPTRGAGGEAGSGPPGLPALPGGLVYRIASFDGSDLRVLGGRDLSRPETIRLAVTFTGVTYVECPVYFGDARLRPGTPAERARLEAVTGFEPELDLHLFAIEADTPGVFRWQVYYVVARGVTVEPVSGSLP